MYKTLHGLVLREVKYKESSKILTILTEEEGKITAEARGALRKGSKCSAASQVLTWSELTFFENRGRYTLTEGSVLEDFAALRADLGDYALGCYMAELLEAVSDEDSHSIALLHLGLNALFALLGKWSFEIFLVHLLLFGYMNELGVEMRGNLAWLAAIAVSVVLSVGYGKAIEHVRKRKQ